MSEGTVPFVVVLPFPWPTSRKIIILAHPSDTSTIELASTDRGNLELKVTDVSNGSVLSFTSQLIVVLGNRPRPVQGMAFWDSRRCGLRLSSQELLPDGDEVPPVTLEPISVRAEKSFEASEATDACKTWIANRKLKFMPRAIRPNRRPKTVQEQAADLLNSSRRLAELSRGVRAGNEFLLGTLSGEIRASIYWRTGRDSQPDAQYNPLLLRMANKGDLPLPVYATPVNPEPRIIGESHLHVAAQIPRIDAIFPTDKIFDLQEVLKRTTLRLGPKPGKTIASLDLVTELSNTMGAAHYDEDASEFVEFLRTFKTEDGDQVANFMCQMAAAIESLSVWVLSELKRLKLIW